MFVDGAVEQGRTKRAVERVVLEDCGEFLISGEATEEEEGWQVKLIRVGNGGEPSGDPRLRLAIRRVCDLDAISARVVARGSVVERKVPAVPRAGEGPYRVGELLAPLLSETEVEGSLYPYQRAGVEWLRQRGSALLGDDMGLGKTAQALTAMRHEVMAGRVEWGLVIAPRTLVSNWQAEARRWAPELAVGRMLSSGPDRESRWLRLIRRAHLVITSYEQIRDTPSALMDISIDLIIADEVHRLRKPDSLVNAGFRRLRSGRRWALTGTPLERDPQDLAVIMSLLEPTRFSASDGLFDPASLRARVRPYVLRRKKYDVLDELPSVVESEELLELSEKQKRSYSRALNEGARTNGSFLALLNELLRICDVDPASGESSKLDRVVDMVEAVAGAGEKVVVFSYLLAPLYRLAERFKNGEFGVGHEILKGDMSLEHRRAALQRFGRDPNCVVLLASTRVGGEGLTLTEANHVIFVNRWWNPSSNNQARDRVVRIGQNRVVKITAFITKGTVEERVAVLLREKAISFDQLINGLANREQGLAEELFGGKNKV